MVRCKFICTERTERMHWKKETRIWDFKFSAVTNGSPENDQFWAATPGGSLQVTSVVSDLFEVGKEYYLDLLLA